MGRLSALQREILSELAEGWRVMRDLKRAGLPAAGVDALDRRQLMIKLAQRRGVTRPNTHPVSKRRRRTTNRSPAVNKSFRISFNRSVRNLKAKDLPGGWAVIGDKALILTKSLNRDEMSQLAWGKRFIDLIPEPPW